MVYLSHHSLICCSGSTEPVATADTLGGRASRKGAKLAKASATMSENEIAKEVVDAALSVHRALGPGLLESVYEAALSFELRDRGLQVQRQVPIPLR